MPGSQDCDQHYRPDNGKLCDYLADVYCNKCGWFSKTDTQTLEKLRDAYDLNEQWALYALEGVEPVMNGLPSPVMGRLCVEVIRLRKQVDALKEVTK